MLRRWSRLSRRVVEFADVVDKGKIDCLSRQWISESNLEVVLVS